MWLLPDVQWGASLDIITFQRVVQTNFLPDYDLKEAVCPLLGRSVHTADANYVA